MGKYLAMSYIQATPTFISFCRESALATLTVKIFSLCTYLLQVVYVTMTKL